VALLVVSDPVACPHLDSLRDRRILVNHLGELDLDPEGLVARHCVVLSSFAILSAKLNNNKLTKKIRCSGALS
jgi:hypothetical protein